MAINYTEVGWDTSKYVNPTNMNQMDDGIKAACDGVDALDASQITLSNGYVAGTQNASVTIPTATATTIGSVTLPTAGLWLIQAFIYLAETSDSKNIGYRVAWIGLNESTTIPANRHQLDAQAVASGIKIDTLVNATAGTTVYFRAYQNSGFNMSTSSNGVLAAKLINA